MMSENFDWQTEEDWAWDEPADSGGPVAPRPRSWPVLLVVLVMVVAAAWVLAREAQQRVEAAAADARHDILSTHNLIRLANRQQDVELFMTVLSGRDRAWTAAQQELMAAGLLFDRPAFGLRLEATTEDTANVDVTLSSDFSSAEVVSTRHYVVESAAGVTETVTVQHAAVYRRGGQQWLLSPPESDFWGAMATSTGEYLTLVYPERDREIALRLASDLDGVLGHMCRSLDGINCPVNLRLLVRLESDPKRLLAAADLENAITSGWRLALPAPTLVGVPLEEASYQAWYRGYAAQVVAAAVTEIVGYDCCRQGLFYRAMLDKQLSQLGLRPWPLTPAVYEQLLTSTSGESPGAGDWTQASVALAAAANWQEVYSIIDFLLATSHPEVTVSDMQRQLIRTNGYRSWRNYFGNRNSNEQGAGPTFATRWLAFVYGQTPSGQLDTPPLLWPEQDIQLVCGVSRSQAINRYNIAAGTWSEEFAYEQTSQSSPGIMPLPDGEGYMIEARRVEPGRITSQLVLKRGSEELIVYEAVVEQPTDFVAAPGMYYTGLADPSGRYLVLSNYYRVAQEIDRRLLDLDNCNRDGCQLQPLTGWPAWSPDGARTLIIEPRLTAAPAERWRAPLSLADERGQSAVAIGTGHSPFWLGNERYGYVRQQEGSSEVIVAGIANGAPQVWLRSADLLGAIPAGAQPEHLFITWVAASPADADILLVYGLTNLERPRRHLLFLVERKAGGIGEMLLLFDTERNMNPWFSPNGRWLTVAHLDDRGTGGSKTFLIDTETRQVQRTFTGAGFYIPPESWSADGRWLLRQHGDQAIILAAPDYDYQKVIVHDFDGCYRLFWANRQ